MALVTGDILFALIRLALDLRSQRLIGIAHNELGQRRGEAILLVYFGHHFINRARHRHSRIQVHGLVEDREILAVKKYAANIVFAVRLGYELVWSRNGYFKLRVLGNISTLDQ